MLLVALLLAPACVVIEIPADDMPGFGGGDSPPRIPEGAKLEGVGADALTYLRGDVPRLVIEVNAAEGFEPDTESLRHMRSVLASVLDKPAGIEFRVSTFEPDRESYTLRDIVETEEQQRTTATTGSEASMHVLALNGEFADSPAVIGMAYSGSGFAIFQEQVTRAAGAPALRPALERAVLVHEAGHLLRLINIGFRSPREREDPDHPHHSLNEDSVMHWAVQNVGVFDALLGEVPDDFDAADRADLEDLKAGHLP